jgi:hypothetical protein
MVTLQLNVQQMCGMLFLLPRTGGSKMHCTAFLAFLQQQHLVCKTY